MRGRTLWLVLSFGVGTAAFAAGYCTGQSGRGGTRAPEQARDRLMALKERSRFNDIRTMPDAIPIAVNRDADDETTLVSVANILWHYRIQVSIVGRFGDTSYAVPQAGASEAIARLRSFPEVCARLSFLAPEAVAAPDCSRSDPPSSPTYRATLSRGYQQAVREFPPESEIGRILRLESVLQGLRVGSYSAGEVNKQYELYPLERMDRIECHARTYVREDLSRAQALDARVWYRQTSDVLRVTWFQD